MGNSNNSSDSVYFGMQLDRISIQQTKKVTDTIQ